MPKVQTSEKLIELLEKSQLAEPKRIEEALQTIRKKMGGSLPSDPEQLSAELQKLKLITRWHSDKLLLGKYKGFFLGKHKLLGHIGSGGMSSVYLAEHTKMHDLRAIKVLPQSKLGKSSYLARFQQEAKAIASLNHPNIVRAHDIDNQGDTHYIVMEYVDGDDLQTIVKQRGPLPFDKVADYIAQVARGLQHAHDVGLIHRDVKPANVLINSKGQVKLLDLGLALFAEDEDASLTMDFNDKVLGTADYLAPEQALNSHRVDRRADLYGLGCTMYFLLTGHPPFPDGTIAQRIAKHQKEMPKEIRKIRPECPGELEGICWKLLQKDPKYRYASADQTADVLQAWLAKYRESKLVTAESASRSTVALGEEHDSRGPSSAALGSAAMMDTVSHQSSDTDAGKSGSSITHLSASDSGVLVKIRSSADESDISSTVNLESEIARRNRARSVAKAKNSGLLNQQQPKAPGTGVAAHPSAAQRPAATSPVPGTSPTTKALWIAGLVIMFILAMLLGVLLAKWTTPEANPPASSALPSRHSNPTTWELCSHVRLPALGFTHQPGGLREAPPELAEKALMQSPKSQRT
ncbi:MAG: serine/threonine protein kinase [bacterium]|nr:serine/threonine protein kinase [bacterium]